jgi:hypothetical protein
MTEAVSTLAGALAPTGSADDEVLRLAATIDIHSPISIQEFGKEVAEHSTAYTDEILNSARAADLDETGRQLNEIVHTAQQFDLDSLEKRHVPDAADRRIAEALRHVPRAGGGALRNSEGAGRQAGGAGRFDRAGPEPAQPRLPDDV